MTRLKIRENETPPHPERTARKRVGDWDSVYIEWRSRKEMARHIRRNQMREHRWDDPSPLVKLTDGEGY